MGKGLTGVSEKLRQSDDQDKTQSLASPNEEIIVGQEQSAAVPAHHPTTVTPSSSKLAGDAPDVLRSSISSTSKLKLGDSRSVKFNVNESEKHFKQGNFQHLKKKTKRFDYEDVRKGKDRLFNVDVATECQTYFRAQRIRVKERKTEHFAFIVDLDSYEYHKVVFHLFLNEILESAFFRMSILLLVLANSVVIGLQTNATMLKLLSEVFNVIDQVILSVFLFEIVIKWIYDFRLFWKVGWNIMDFLIIFLVMLAATIPAFRNSKALVVVRVVRAFRSLRSVSFLSSLKVVMQTILRSGVDMGNILLVLMIFMLVMSIMGVILFDLPELETKHFLSAVDAWFVLFICVTQDGWNQVLDQFRNTQYFAALACYLILAVSIGAFVFANLIVAVIVANLELSVKEMREENKLSNNALEFNSKTSANVVEMLPIYDVLCKHNIRVLSQRPLRIPNLRKLSQRKIQTYISSIMIVIASMLSASVIVALEQNMLEAEIIRVDLEKILAVILSVVLQLDMFSQQKAHEDELNRRNSYALAKSKQIDGASQINVIPPPTPSKTAAAVKPMTTLPDIEDRKSDAKLAFMQLLKNRRSANE